MRVPLTLCRSQTCHRLSGPTSGPAALDGYDYDTFADDLASLIELLDLHEVTLIGHSLGCSEIVRYLSRHGDARVERLVLLAPTAPPRQRPAPQERRSAMVR